MGGFYTQSEFKLALYQSVNCYTGAGPGGIPGPPYSPLIIDVGQNQFELSGSVSFDINNSGSEDSIQWVSIGSDDAFLVIDVNSNGSIDNGSELFGTASILFSEQKLASDGFEALAQYDSTPLGGNADSFITSEDAIWVNLLLWTDFNANGQTDEGELSPLEDAGIELIPTIPHRSSGSKIDGVLVLSWAWAKKSQGKGNKKNKLRVVDAYLDVVQ